MENFIFILIVQAMSQSDSINNFRSLYFKAIQMTEYEGFK